MLIPHQWKNKGILVPVYIVASFVGFNILLGVLKRNVGGIFKKIGIAYSLIGVLLIAGAWIYFTCETYYKDNVGNKKKLDIPHEFYWIKMKHWAYLLWIAALALFIYKLCA